MMLHMRSNNPLITAANTAWIVAANRLFCKASCQLICFALPQGAVQAKAADNQPVRRRGWLWWTQHNKDCSWAWLCLCLLLPGVWFGLWSEAL